MRTNKAIRDFSTPSAKGLDCFIRRAATMLLLCVLLTMTAWASDFTTSTSKPKRAPVQDGYWNTLCLPFDVTLENGPFQGAELMELDTEANVNGHKTGFSDGTLYLNFKPSPSIEAGKPYIIKWEVESSNNASSYYSSRVFGDVTATAAGSSVTSEDGKVTFCGTYTPITFTNDKSILYLGSNNTLYWPEGEVTLNSFLAYFQLNDITADDLNPTRAFVLSFDDEMSSVDI